MRVVRNTYTDWWDKHPDELRGFPEQMGRSSRDGALHLGGDTDTGAVDPDKECYPAGQGVGAIHELVPAGEVVRRLDGRGRGDPRPPAHPALLSRLSR